MIEKLIKDGMVAVVYSPGFGAGWSTWADKELEEMMLFDKDIAEAVLRDDRTTAANLALEKAKSGYVYTGGARNLEIYWLPVGTKFEVMEYDGSESIRVIDQIDYWVA